MIISEIQTFPLRIPFKPGHVAAASVWGPKDLAAVDSLAGATERAHAVPGPQLGKSGAARRAYAASR